MKNAILFFSLLALIFACGGPSNDGNADKAKKPAKKEAAKKDTKKGIGEYTNVELNTPLNASMVKSGEAVYDMKCSACHKKSAQRVVGPGFEGVTTRRTPEWIMNMVTNVEIMLEEDPAAQEMLKECLVRMPNQNLTAQDARDVLEWMYANDGKEVGE